MTQKPGDATYVLDLAQLLCLSSSRTPEDENIDQFIHLAVAIVHIIAVTGIDDGNDGEVEDEDGRNPRNADLRACRTAWRAQVCVHAGFNMARIRSDVAVGSSSTVAKTRGKPWEARRKQTDII